MVGRIEDQRICSRIGYFRIYCPTARSLVCVHGGYLGVLTEDVARAIWLHLVQMVDGGTVDLVLLKGVRTDSLLLSVIPEMIAAPWGLYMSCLMPYYQLVLEDDPMFLGKRLRSKHRIWLRGRENRLRENVGRNLQWRWHREFRNLDHLMEQLETVAAKTYQRKLGAGFRLDDEHRQRFALFVRQNTLRVLTLETGGSTLAFWIGVLSGSAFYASETGYDPALSVYEPGTLGFLKTVENLVHEHVRLFDFGLGDAEYKRRFGDRVHWERDLYIFRQSFAGLAGAFLNKYVGKLNDFTIRLPAKIGRLNRVKSIWRRQARQSLENN